jgi:hypothetical protein
VNWFAGTLQISRGIVRQRVGDVKTSESEQKVSIDPDMLEVLKAWKQTTQFSLDEDWIFASPAKLGACRSPTPTCGGCFRKLPRGPESSASVHTRCDTPSEARWMPQGRALQYSKN